MFRRYAEIVKRLSPEEALRLGLDVDKRFVRLRCWCGAGNDMSGSGESLIVELQRSHVKITSTEITYPDLPMPVHYMTSGVNGHGHSVLCPASGKRLGDLKTAP